MKKFREEQGKSWAERATAIRDRGEAGATAVRLLKGAELAIEEGGPTGTMAESILRAKSFFAALGVDPEAINKLKVGPNLGMGELIRALNTDLALTKVALTKGQISNAEMKLFLESVLSLGNTQEANRLIVSMMKGIAQRNVDIANAAKEYRKTNNGGPLDDGFDDVLDQMAETPLIPEQRAVIEGTYEATGGTGVLQDLGTATPPGAQGAGPKIAYKGRRFREGNPAGLPPGKYDLLEDGTPVRVGD